MTNYHCTHIGLRYVFNTNNPSFLLFHILLASGETYCFPFVALWVFFFPVGFSFPLLLVCFYSYLNFCDFSSVQFSCSVVFDSAPPWIAACQASLSITNSWIHPNPCPLSRWCHPTVSSSCRPLLLLPPNPPSIRVFSSESVLRMGCCIGVSASASVLPMNTQDWSPLGWTGWISLQSKGLPRVFSNTTVQKHQFFGAQLSSQSISHIRTWPLGKP